MGKACAGHVMMVPYPAQGHVIPQLELAHILASHHTRITFVITENIHNLVLNYSSSSSSGKDEEEDDSEGGRISFVSVPDGLESWERDVPGKLMDTVWRIMPAKIEELIQEMNGENEEDEKVTCLICDVWLGTIREVARKMGIQSAVYMGSPAAVFVPVFNIPKLIHDGIIDNQGTPLHNNAFQLSQTMPIMTASDLVWHCVKPEISTVRKLMFDILRQNKGSIESAEWVLCNSTYNLELGAFTHAPHITPIGPLPAITNPGHRNSEGHFWKQDLDSLEWLHQQPLRSVIYVAFGSTTILNKAQFQELALGLEQTNRPFLWVVRIDHHTTSKDAQEKQEFPEGFLERVGGRGRIIGWAPQQKVLSHPSIACFVTHCGWNSVMESLRNGVPMLCSPYFADHFIIRIYITDIWRVGLQFQRYRNGNFTSREFQKKVDLLLRDMEFKERALQLQEMMESNATEGGTSYNNLRNFITWIHQV